MRHLMAAAIGLLLSIGTAQPANSGSDEAAIKEVFASFSRIWDTPGMPGFEELFTDDADFVVVTGKWLKGRDTIVSYHRELLKSRYAGSKQLPQTVNVRFLTPEIAIAHFASGARYTQDGQEHTRTGLGTATLVKREGRWRIAAFQNTLTSGPGALLPANPNL
jgi:uncharacterized protein (TIGR02246 family)